MILKGSSSVDHSVRLHRQNDPQYREEYVEGHAKDTIAFQLRRMRLANDWEQKDVAARLGNAKVQPMVSRYENPDYGKYSVTTLLELAKVFDVALVVRFAKFSELLRWDSHKTDATLQPAGYMQDAELCAMGTETWMWEKRLGQATPNSCQSQSNRSSQAPTLRAALCSERDFLCKEILHPHVGKQLREEING